MSRPIIEVQQIGKSYRRGPVEVPALRRASFTVQRGEFVAIMGPSGSGKSTLLYLLGGLIRPSAGRYCLDGRDVTQLSAREWSRLRNRYIGFVFQAYHLLPGLNALRNVELPALYAGRERGERRRQARALLECMGLGRRLLHCPPELSGGEIQRVSIARALINDPPLLLGDEPTGNLDSTTGNEIMELLAGLAQEGRTVILVTHDAELAARWVGRILRIRDGVLEEQ